MKVSGQVYAQQNQQSAFDVRELILCDSIERNQHSVHSSMPTLPNTVSHSKKMIYEEDPTKNAMLNASIARLQPSKMNLKSLHAIKKEDGLHRAKFDSLFQSATIVNTDHETMSHLPAKESAVPKLLLKRKAAWSGVVAIRGSDAANDDIVEKNPDVLVTEVRPPQQQAGVADIHAVRLQFQHQRYVCSKQMQKYALNLKIAGD